MHAMVLKQPGSPLQWTELPDRQPGRGEIRIKVATCGVCRTDLHAVDGELPHPQVPIIPGHEIVGRFDAVGRGAEAPPEPRSPMRVSRSFWVIGAAMNRCRPCSARA